MSLWPRVHHPPAADLHAGAALPLRGLSVILTRPVSGGVNTRGAVSGATEKENHCSGGSVAASRSWAVALAAAGAEVLEAPALALAPLAGEAPTALTAELRQLIARRGWLIVPSPAAVFFFLDRLEHTNLAPAEAQELRIAVIGPAGAERLAGAGLAVSFQPPEPTGAALAASLPGGPGVPVLIAGSRQTRPELSGGLTARGMVVRTMALYAPCPFAAGLDAIAEAISADPGRVIVVSSPSGVDAVHGRILAMDDWPGRLRWGAIGATTARRLLELGVDPHRVVTAAVPDVDGLINALAPWADDPVAGPDKG